MNSLQPVLLIEDDLVDVMTVKRCFKHLKIPNELWVAENGEAALNLLHDFAKPRPCIILLDINMPIMNGLEFLKAFKSHDDLKHTPVVILTSSKEEKDVMCCYGLGVAGYLVKPIEYKQFVKSINLLNNYWSMNELPL